MDILHCNVNDANFHLKSGTATIDDAKAWVDKWNNSKKAMSIAELRIITNPFSTDSKMEIPQIKLL